MKLLFTYYIPSGGMETLNRIRCKALQEQGIVSHLLYNFDSEGRHNIKNIPTYVTNDDLEIKGILVREKFDAVIICTDYLLMERIRRLGYNGTIIYEVQGLGPHETIQLIMQNASPNIRLYSNAIMYPKTPHLIDLFQAAFPEIIQFCFDNPLDTEHFGYISYPSKKFPIMGWVGRIEKNKNWSDFLMLGYWMIRVKPNMHLWMFENAKLFEAAEKEKFEAMVNDLNLRPRLIRYSNVPHDQMADYLSIIGDSGGFLCSSSILEGFGYAVAEAMLCRCPVLSTDSDGVKRFIIHNETGKFFPHGNVTQAIEEARELMDNEYLRNTIRLNGEKHVKSIFSTKQYAKHFIAMMMKLGHGGVS
jgi:glycosyltransferase involved in cell wall biosynthesis